MSKAYLQGRPRDAAPGKRPWRVRAYSPGPGFPRGRVVFKDAETGKLVTRTPDDGQDLEQLFDLVERALGQNVALARTSGTRDLTALSDRYLDWLRGQGRDPDYINNRRSLLNKWLLREHGDVPVAKWGPQLSLRVIANARKSVGANRVEDLGVALSGLRKTAWRPDDNGVRWMAPDFDPLEGVSYSKGSTRGGRASYVERSARPDTKAVLTAIEATRARAGRFDAAGWAEQVELAGFGGLRLSEQLGIRASDLDAATCSVTVNGVWMHPHGQLPYRRPYTKTMKPRVVPLPASLFAKLQALVPAAEARVEARRKDAAAARAADAMQKVTLADGTSAEVPLADWIERENDAFLFCDPRTGWPWTQEQFNTEWHRITAATKRLAKEDPTRWQAWPQGVPYRNLRHHTATWWNEELEFAWTLVAEYLGNSYEVCLAHYVRTSGGDHERARAALAGR